MIKQIVVDNNNCIVQCSVGGLLENGITLEDIPNYVLSSPDIRKYCYTSELGFYENPNYVPPDNLSSLKETKIAESKTKLAAWLAENPMQYTDGKFYSVTAEKQSLLNSNLASYERATQAGIPYPLKWNSTGEECIEWEYTNLLTLSLTIAAYVAPKVAKQQSIEVAINNCTTVDEVEAIVIDYDAE